MAKKRSNEVAETLSGRDTEREATMLRALPAKCRELVDKAVLDTGAPFEPSAVAMLKKLRGDDLAAWQRTRALLDALVARLEHYVSLPKGGAVAVAVWALYTWCFRAFSVSPYLMVTAPERESGKSRVTELLSWMVQRDKPVSDASAATIYRGVDRDGPTLLFDETQDYLNRRPDDPIRGMLRSGFNLRFANVERMVGEGTNMEERSFSTFCPKVMNGRNLVTIDDMLTSRSVVLPMTRATRAYPHLRADRDPVGEDIRRQCARWRDDHLSALREADPDVDTRIHRNADVWRPLFAVADAAGGEWPEKVRAAADALAAVSGTIDTGETLGTMLLADVRAVFTQRGDPERIQSKVLDMALRALPERPWDSMPKTGKAITAQARGRMLARYGVNAETLRFDAGEPIAKGYKRAAFADAWNAYLPEGDGDRTVTPLQSHETSTFSDSRTVTGNEGCNGSESAETPAKQGTVTVQRFGNRGARREDAADAGPVATSGRPSRLTRCAGWPVKPPLSLTRRPAGMDSRPVLSAPWCSPGGAPVAPGCSGDAIVFVSPARSSR